MTRGGKPICAHYAGTVSLPVETTGEDVRELVAYLRNKTRATRTGATLAETADSVRPEIVSGRKLAAYETWGLVEREGDRLTLAPRGWELAQRPETERTVFREILDSIPPYRSALEWMHHRGFADVTTADVRAQWQEHHIAALGSSNGNTIRENVVAFFRLAEAAGLGQLTQGGGRGRTPTRFTIDREELKSLVEAGPTAVAAVGRLTS